MIVSRISWATWGSCLRSSFRRSRGVSIESSSLFMSLVRRGLMPALADETRDGREEIHRAADDISVVERLLLQPPHLRTCAFHAQKRGPGQFSLRDVLAGGLAEGRRGLLDVQQVVHDLEGETERVGVAAKRR